MKTLLLLCALVAAGYANLLTPYKEGDRFFFMADDSGKLHLIDAEEKVDPAPQGRNVNAYFLFTRNNLNSAQTINDGNIGSSLFNAGRQTKFIVHGWTGNGHSESNISIKNAILAICDCNVISVDWSSLAGGSYNNAVAGVPSVGREIGRFVQVVRNRGVAWSNIHLIGFSLGGHAVGIAGRTVGGQAARVTGLDPAGPLWTDGGERLRNSDGVYVEVIHTNAGTLGYRDPIGNADFYPNGGATQSGCGVLGVDCSHGRSYLYFAESVRTNQFIGRGCGTVSQALASSCTGNNFLSMGMISLPKSGNGIYHLFTNDRSPFARG